MQGPEKREGACRLASGASRVLVKSQHLRCSDENRGAFFPGFGIFLGVGIWVVS